LPADSKYIDNGKLHGSENDSAAYNSNKKFTFGYTGYLTTEWSQTMNQQLLFLES